MSLGRRFLNLARAEVLDAARKILGQEKEASPFVEPAFKTSRPPAPPPIKNQVEESPEIRRYYANLELPIGASKEEVKAAYRRLMRRYHPDKHQGDAAKAEAATRLAAELRVAYEGLLAHLEKTGGS